MDLSLKIVTMYKKVQNLSRLKKITAHLKRDGRRVAFTNGCFDILHAGHIKYLQAAKKTADILIVAVNSDNSVKRLKGKNRPITPLKQRMEILSALEPIDFVISFSAATPYKLIKALRPDILIKGGDWKPQDIVGRDIVESYGGRAINIVYIKGISTTEFIKKIAKRFKRT